MDVPVKKLARLLKREQPAEIRSAAVVVVSALGIKDSEIAAELIAGLGDESETVRMAALKAVGNLKVTKALPILLERIKAGGEESTLAADAAAKLGAEGVKGLRELMGHVAPGLRRGIAAALSGAGSAGAEAGIAVLLDKDRSVSEAAAAAIIARIPSFTPQQRKELVEELVSLASDKKTRLPAAAELPVVRILASLNDPASEPVLWERLRPSYPFEVRAAVLQAIGEWAKNANKERRALLFACAADGEFRVVAPALMLLDKLPNPEKFTSDWLELLHAPDTAARMLAIKKIGDRDAKDVASALMEQLSHADRGVRDAARMKLVGSKSGKHALAAAVLLAEHTDETWAMAKSVAPFVASLPKDTLDLVFAKGCAYLENNDPRVDPLLFLLREADAASLRDKLFERAIARRKKKDYETSIKYLKVLARDPAIGFPIRLESALVGLKLSNHDLSSESRANDPCLRRFEQIVEQNFDETFNQIEKAKWLDESDLYYLGFHFVERTGKDKEFGASLLKLTTKLSPRSKAATAAKNKLKTVALV